MGLSDKEFNDRCEEIYNFATTDPLTKDEWDTLDQLLLRAGFQLSVMCVVGGTGDEHDQATAQHIGELVVEMKNVHEFVHFLATD